MDWNDIYRLCNGTTEQSLQMGFVLALAVATNLKLDKVIGDEKLVQQIIRDQEKRYDDKLLETKKNTEDLGDLIKKLNTTLDPQYYKKLLSSTEFAHDRSSK